jgi:hypothetical protein
LPQKEEIKIMTTSSPEKQKSRKATARKARPVSPQPAVAPSKAKAAKKSGTAKKATDTSKTGDSANLGSKTSKISDLLKRDSGVTLKELMKATGWQSHSVRGFLSGTLKKKMGMPVESFKNAEGNRCYRVSAT